MGYKIKTINSIIAKKHAEWVASIDDPKTKALAKKNTIITGGCIASMLLGEEVNDFDCYFRDRETTLAVANYYVEKFNAHAKTTAHADGRVIEAMIDETKEDRVHIKLQSAGIASEDGAGDYRYFEMAPEAGSAGPDDYVETAMKIADEDKDDSKPKYRPVFLSSNAITLSHRMQLITRFYGEPSEIHGNYDFVHCTNYWDSGEGKVTTNLEALQALLAKELKYVGSKYPLCSVIRSRKFIQRGWSINAGQYLKMLMQVSELDLTNVRVLEDQLIGVDTAYFKEVINKIKEKGGDKVDAAYLVEIIDRMF